jgi:hypothetical protein
VAAAALVFAFAVQRVVGVVLLVCCVVAGALLLVPRARPAAPIVLGVGLTVVATFGGILLVLLAGCGSSNGHIDTGVWIGGGVLFFACAAWAVRHPRRVWWALPLSMLVGWGFVVGLAVLLTGSTGACPD